MTVALVVALVALGAVVALDGVGAGQFMVSRPLVVGLAAGWLLGDAAAGVAVGALLETYLLVSVPSGGGRFPEPGPATVVGVAAAIWTGGAAGLALGVAAGLVAGELGAWSQSLLRRRNAHRVPVPGDGGPVGPGDVVRAHLGCLAMDAARGAALTALGLAAVALTAPALARAWSLDGVATRGLVLLGALVSLGILARGEAPRLARAGLFAAAAGGGWLLGVSWP